MYHQPRINLRSLIGLLIQWLLFVTYAKTFPTAFALRCSVLHWPKEGILSYAPLETTFDCVAGNIGRPLRTTNTTHHARASDVVIDTPLIGTGSHPYCSLIQPHKSPRRASVAGAAALVPRGGCLFVHKLELLSRVGATVALVYNTNSDAPFAADGPQADRDDDDDQELNDIIDPLRDVSLEGYPADSEQEPTAHMPMPPTNNEHMSVFIMISEEAGAFLEALVADDNPDRATVVGGTSRRETEVRLIVSRAVTKRSISKLTPGGNHDTTTLTTQSFDSFSRSTHTRTGRTRRGRTRRRRTRSPVGATVYSPSTVSVEDDKLPNMFAEPTVHDVTNKPVSFHGFFAGGLMDLKVGEPGGIGRTVKRNNETIQVDHKVTMLEADEGSSFTVAVTRRQLCSMCDGQGALPTAMVPCPACKADEAGVMEMSHPLGHTCRQHREVTCPVCAGHGEVIGVGESPCPHCGGKRVVSENTILNVTIPPGVKNLHEIVLSGAGHAKPLYQPGDVIVIVHVDRDARYIRNDTDLHLLVPMTLREALDGFERSVPLLNGTHILIRRYGITTPGTVQRVVGAGFTETPSPRAARARAANAAGTDMPPTPTTKGDLVLAFDIEVDERTIQHRFGEGALSMGSLEGTFVRMLTHANPLGRRQLRRGEADDAAGSRTHNSEPP